MDVGGSDQESSLFQAFIVPSVGIENKNVNKINDPIKQTNLGDQEVLKADSHKDDHPQPSDAQCKRFDEFAALPVGLRKYVAKDLIGTPLEDIDPFYKDKQVHGNRVVWLRGQHEIGASLAEIISIGEDTFIVVNRDKNLFRFSSSKALWVLRPNNVVRRTAASVLTHPFWAIFMIIVILINCIISLATRGGDIFQVPWELIFLIIYLVEFAIKVLARGFVLDKYTYLRDLWNCFDLILIVIAITAMCINPQEAIYYSPVLCELRVLKICSLSLSLRRTIKIYWQSLLKMRDLLLYILFILFVVAILCVQMYQGMLTQHCVKAPKNGEGWSSFTGNPANVFSEGAMHRACGNSSGAQHCPTNYVCLMGEKNPNYGFTSFDSAFRSYFVVLRIIQRDFWEEVMQYLTATSGPWHILLFIALIYYGSFQLCALLWTPIALAYNHLKDEQWENDLLNDLNEVSAQMPLSVLVKQRESSEAAADKANNPGCFAKFQRCVFNVIYNPFAVLFVIICILLNTLFMALDHHNMPIELETVLRAGNYFFVVVFVIEAILKLTALGPAQYFKDEWNTFDFIVTALGVIELCVEGVQGLSVLRAFRLLRPLRLGRIVPAFDLLMKRVRHLFSALRNQTIILCMFIYIFVVFGCRAFGKNYVDNEQLFPDQKLPRWNFTDIFHSFMVVFRALCGEWVESLYDCILVNDDTSIVYFCALAFIGSFVILHLFVALILTNDDSSVLSASNASSSNVSNTNQSTTNRKFNLHTFLKEKLLEPNILKIYDANKPIKNDMETQAVSDAPASIAITLSSNQPDDKNHSQSKLDDDKKRAVGQSDTKDTVTSSVVVVAPVATTEDEDEDDATINNWSKFRVKALKFNESTYFGYIVLVIIFIASIALVHAVNSSSFVLAGTSLVVELAFCIVMIIEFISKIISCGWKSYFKNIWCLIDLFNTIVPIVGLFTANQTILILKALRPISLVSRCSGLKIIAERVGRQARMLFNSLVICAAFWLIFAIMGVQMFAGKFYHCVDERNETLKADFVANRNACITKHYDWTNEPVNFDNVIEAYLSLLQVATFKGWIQIIRDAVDSREVDSQPLQEGNIYMFLYFVIFTILGVFICANLIVGILIKQTLSIGNLSNAFSSSKSSKRRSMGSNDSGYEITHDISTSSKLATFARSVYFDWIAFGLSVFYIIVLAFDRYHRAKNIAHAIQIIEFVCAVLFIIETGLRLHSQRRGFLLNLWNFYDSVVVILLLCEIIAIEFTNSTVISVSMLRVIRVLRFKSLFIPYSNQLKLGWEALRQSRAAAFNLCLFLFMVIFVYALIGVVAFKRVEDVTPINDRIAFNGVGGAIILLFQLSTSAGWDGTYIALIKDHAFNPFAVFLYLWTFLFICILTIVNLVLTIILNYYAKASEIEEEPKKLRANDLHDFDDKWRTIAAQDQPLFINKSQLPILLNRLEKTSTLRSNITPNEENIQLLGIPIHNEQQMYRGDVLIALNKNRLRTLSK